MPALATPAVKVRDVDEPKAIFANVGTADAGAGEVFAPEKVSECDPV
jgi:hypothetical protein